jgi:nicotinamidase-related amidase
MKRALLVIDIQQYFMEDAPSSLPRDVVEHYQTKANNYGLVCFAAFRNQPGSNFVRSLKWDKCSSDQDVILPPAFQPYIRPDNVFERTAYSVFKDARLHAFLQEHEVDRLVLCGVDTDACVLGTAFEAFDLGYHVEINFDLTHSSNNLKESAQKIANRILITRS